MEATVTIKLSLTEINVLRAALTQYMQWMKETINVAGPSDKKRWNEQYVRAEQMGKIFGM